MKKLIALLLAVLMVLGMAACAAAPAKTEEKTEEKADVTLGINAFSALICGTSDWRDAVQWMPDVTLHRENPELEGVFYRKKLWIGDYF